MYIYIYLPMAPNLTLQEHIITHTLWHILNAEMQNNIATPHLCGQQNFKITSRLRILFVYKNTFRTLMSLQVSSPELSIHNFINSCFLITGACHNVLVICRNVATQHWRRLLRLDKMQNRNINITICGISWCFLCQLWHVYRNQFTTDQQHFFLSLHSNVFSPHHGGFGTETWCPTQ
jgi:hypothetical protein